MADMLIMHPELVSAVPPGPSRWEALMPVDVFPDGQLGPGTQQHPSFIIIRVPGVSVEDLYDLLADVRDGNNVMTQRRFYTGDWNTLSTPIQTEILTNREYTLTEAQLRAFLGAA